MPRNFRKAPLTRAFTRWELCVALALISLIFILGFCGLAVMNKIRNNSRREQCLDNLKAIGASISVYGAENKDKLPFAGARTEDGNQISWDDLLNKALGMNAPRSDLEASVMGSRLKIFQCPSDDMASINPWLAKKNAYRRSYAMPSHNMSARNWPPSSLNRTGAGLLWDTFNPSIFPESINRWTVSARHDFLVQPREQAAFKGWDILSPATTMLFTEKTHTNNVIGNILSCTIDNATEHARYLPVKMASAYHMENFGYVFADGHAEMLEPLMTLGKTNRSPAIQSGIWTVNPED